MKKKLIKSGDLVLIEWRDAGLFPSGVYTKEDCLELHMGLFKSAGYLLSRDKTITRIAAEKNEEGDFRNILLIPTGSIISIVCLFSRAGV